MRSWLGRADGFPDAAARLVPPRSVEPRIAAPAAWLGPELTTARALATAQFQSERPQGDAPQGVTLAEGTRARTAVAVTAFAQWSDATGAGSYECCHLFVQLEVALVADVIACGAHVRGSSTPAPDLRRAQERVALWLGSAGAQ